MVTDEPVPSPCVSICRMDPAADLCFGCLRTLDEIVEWGSASNDRKRAILDAVASRRVA